MLWTAVTHSLHYSCSVFLRRPNSFITDMWLCPSNCTLWKAVLCGLCFQGSGLQLLLIFYINVRWCRYWFTLTASNVWGRQKGPHYTQRLSSRSTFASKRFFSCSLLGWACSSLYEIAARSSFGYPFYLPVSTIYLYNALKVWTQW